ncbi:phosphopantetheine-binding protein [Echinimonas agarilytica]|uniref:Phosphopantetheine-binding protein n=1 Tax=Echinimonas agarilytica TaxID=1215918 RepID=A0AA42B910_9GAMM|nr:phosphopantetheine-binding protein [Echinimonas agarilytica]MCM2681505.1 phosphopantetheine-binding protein [Echinimonas agarilytica]
MTTLEQTQQQRLEAILQQLLPSHAIAQWQDDTGLIGDIAEFDSMTLTNLLTSIEDVFNVEIDESALSLDDFATWGSLKQYTRRLLDA